MQLELLHLLTSKEKKGRFFSSTRYSGHKCFVLFHERLFSIFIILWSGFDFDKCLDKHILIIFIHQCAFLLLFMEQRVQLDSHSKLNRGNSVWFIWLSKLQK